jgi:hypothetical protein
MAGGLARPYSKPALDTILSSCYAGPMAKRRTAKEGDIWLYTKEGVESHFFIVAVSMRLDELRVRRYVYHVVLLETGEERVIDSYYPMRHTRHWLNGTWRPTE